MPPQAKIVLMGYPHVSEPGVACYYTADSATWIASMSDFMDGALWLGIRDDLPASWSGQVVFSDPGLTTGSRRDTGSTDTGPARTSS